jgi:hypothetical protein
MAKKKTSRSTRTVKARTTSAKPDLPAITFQLPGRQFTFEPREQAPPLGSDLRPPSGARSASEARAAARTRATFDAPVRPEDLRKAIAEEAAKWTYVLRNRQRWSTEEELAVRQRERAADSLKKLCIQPQDIASVAESGRVEVTLPPPSGENGDEPHIFPWEYVFAGATREARRGRPLTMTRHLDVPDAKPSRSRPSSVLYVESTPGSLRGVFSFETEKYLCRSSLRISAGKWHELYTPTLEELEEAIRKLRPDVIHLAGFDSHQAYRLLEGDNKNSIPPPDGYVLAWPGGDPRPVDAGILAQALCAGGHRPVLVSFSIHNSSGRIAPKTVAAGAGAAIAFQDSFDDDLVELFFATFYRSWRKSSWDLSKAFQTAWETVRNQNKPLDGSGLVLWSARSLLLPRRKTAEPKPALPRTRMPDDVEAREASSLLRLHIEPCKELNYSLLHNRCPLFKRFTLLNASADNGKDEFAALADIDVTVTLGAGSEVARYDRRFTLDVATLDLTDWIHLPLTSALLRSVHESINSSMMVEVTWGKFVSRNTYPVRLLPVDQWRDNDKDGQWLPSFVLPRDKAVMGLVDKARHYVRVLRDDPASGFDGYQSVEPEADDPSAEVDLQVQALWSAIVHELKLGYINPPPSYNNEFDSQRLRTPATIVENSSGTCLDLAMLFAACCELIDVYPVIFLLEDHAFPGYWREDAFQQRFIEVSDDFVGEIQTEEQEKNSAAATQKVAWWFRKSAYREILREVKQGRLVPLESVWLTEHSGFWSAVEGGEENLKSRSRFHSMIDIARARRANVTPLPISVQP